MRRAPRWIPSGGLSWRPEMVVAVIGGGWVLADGSGLLGPLTVATFPLLGAASVVCSVAGIRRNRPVVRWPWISLTAAMLLFLAAGVLRLELHTLGNLGPSRSVWPDVIAFPGYGTLAVTLYGIRRSQRMGRERDFDALLDASVAGLAVLSVSWRFLIEPALSLHHVNNYVRLLLAGYPPASVFLLVLTARLLLLTGGARSISQRAVVLGIGFMAIGDVLYMLADTRLASVPGNLLDVPYGLAYVAVCVAVLHPSMARVGPARDMATGTGMVRIVFLAVAFGLPAMLAAFPKHGTDPVLAPMIVGLTGLAIVRMTRTLRAHSQAEERLLRQATHDPLTQLANRAALNTVLAVTLEEAGLRRETVAVLFVDLDRFKVVNDTLGHSFGDELLVQIAGRLRGTISKQDLIARIGGDEFVVVLRHLSSVDDAHKVAERIRCVVSRPVAIGNTEIFPTASVGVAHYEGSEFATTAEAMIRDADTAMYQAKDGGRNRVAAFDQRVLSAATERLQLERDLRHAMERGELALHYQPIVDLPTWRIVGMEALLRWKHPSRGFVPPSTFIPLAEEIGMISEIGTWVLEEAVAEAARWRAWVPGGENVTVSVNVSARQVVDGLLVAQAVEVCERHRLPPTALNLEVTESVLVDGSEATLETMRQLRARGIGLALDDFGTGFSSLSYLKKFPVSSVKIDRSFVDGLRRSNTSDESLVAAIVAMAAALGMRTVAEGVELLDQENRLRQLGCHSVQGYLYSAAVPAPEIAGLIARFNTGIPIISLPPAEPVEVVRRPS